MVFFRFLVVVKIVLLLSGCYGEIERSDITGIYHANHEHGSEVLQIFENGEYILTYVDLNGNKFSNKNLWEFSRGNKNEPRLTFNSYIFGYRYGNHGADIPGFWYVEAEKSLMGNVMLNIDPDLGYYFVKDEK